MMEPLLLERLQYPSPWPFFHLWLERPIFFVSLSDPWSFLTWQELLRNKAFSLYPLLTKKEEVTVKEVKALLASSFFERRIYHSSASRLLQGKFLCFHFQILKMEFSELTHLFDFCRMKFDIDKLMGIPKNRPSNIEHPRKKMVEKPSFPIVKLLPKPCPWRLSLSRQEQSRLCPPSWGCLRCDGSRLPSLGCIGLPWTLLYQLLLQC